MLTEILLFLVFCFSLLYWYVTKHFGYFKRLGISEEPGSFPFGSESAWKSYTKGQSFLKFFDQSIKKYKNEKLHGMYHFGQRQLVVTDLELAKQITIKDADHFVDRLSFGGSYKDAITESDKMFALFLTSMTGDDWKKMRAIVSPVFTSGKLKLMVPHISRCGANIAEHLKTAALTGEVLEAKDMFGKFTLDSIATSGFGIESNSFKDPENIFRVNAMKIVRHPKYARKMDLVKFMVVALSPKLARFLGFSALDPVLSKFFIDIVRKTMENRRKSGVRRNDIIDIFIDELDKQREDNFLASDFELGIVSTAILFFFAGFDTTATTLAVVVYALINYPETQERLRQEIDEVIGTEENITAEHLKELKYTENVINEAMRYYFTFGIQRTCTRDYKVPGMDFTIEKGIIVNAVPPKEECFKNPDNFDPDNFDPQNNPNKFGFTAFGHGPRACIGMRYAYQTLKIATVHTIRNFRLLKCSETTKEEDLNFSIAENGFVGGFKFKVEQIDNE